MINNSQPTTDNLRLNSESSFAGSSVGMPCASAQTLTSLGASSRPRPFGFGGAVMMREGRMPSRAISSKTMTEMRDVPQNAMRRSSVVSMVMFVFLSFLFLACDPFDIARGVDEEDAVQVVSLVLEYLREEPASSAREYFSIFIIGANGCLVSARDL